MANDRNGDPIVDGNVYTLAGPVRRVDGDSVLIVAGRDGHEMAVRVAAGDIVPVGSGGGPHTHTALSVTVDDSKFTGALAGKEIKTVQALADYIDANLTP